MKYVIMTCPFDISWPKKNDNRNGKIRGFKNETGCECEYIE